MGSVSKRRAIQTARARTCSNSTSFLLTMPGFLDDSNFGALSCKLITVCPNNVHLGKSLPTINANITLFDETTGILKAIISGNEITKWRTAAASVVATKYLTAKKGLRVLAILGAGAQGEIHAVAFQHFFNFEEANSKRLIRIWNHNTLKAEKLVSKLNQLYCGTVFKCFKSNEMCVKEADVIITATFASEPIVQLKWLKKGTHINAVGAGLTHYSELSESIYLASDVYIDYSEGAEAELTGLKELGVEFKGEIGTLVSGGVSPSSVNQITVFQSLGMAVEDCAMARMVYDLYKKQYRNV
ncbi:ketimine reductase mu-crystallin [Asbolus verrucosus]|uniref:Ketimine reductase mu-crystallin n=1 Tax=Asbolus verrucosus TaxID=1661398 RepID=A0A482WDR3_ASBVE|nr:ketimine reductase mu-crystallin [Asbolus verrucosus]